MAANNINADNPGMLIARLEEAGCKLDDCFYLFEQLQRQYGGDGGINSLARIGQAIAKGSSDLALDAAELAREAMEA